MSTVRLVTTQKKKPPGRGAVRSSELLNWAVEGTVKFFKDLTKVLVLNETSEFNPATASLFDRESAVSGNEPRVVVKHSSN